MFLQLMVLQAYVCCISREYIKNPSRDVYDFNIIFNVLKYMRANSYIRPLQYKHIRRNEIIAK